MNISNKQNIKLTRNILGIVLLFFLTSITLKTFGQKNVVSVGKEFWFGFMSNGQDGGDQNKLEIYVTSKYNTNGILTFPASGYTVNFSVIANEVTTLHIPNDIAEHITSETVENRGILIETSQDVSVFYLNYSLYSSDATNILSRQSLGINYMINSFDGLPSGSPFLSEFLIVATEDNTTIEIVPSVNTRGGHHANTPFTVLLNRGQSYQVQAVISTLDVSGTLVRATSTSGECRPFAVFSGHESTYSSPTCSASDHICAQNIPIESWGKEYLVAPYLTSSYRIKILAKDSNSIININGTNVDTLDAGQSYNNFYNSVTPLSITCNNNISVIQLMSGDNCSGSKGDPSMIILYPRNQLIDSVTFGVYHSNYTTNHFINIISHTSDINQISINGVNLNPSIFIPFTYNPNYSYAQISLNQSDNTVIAPNGIQGYVYGYGNHTFESYSYSLGSNNEEENSVIVDDIICSNDSLSIGNNEQLYNTWWTTLSNPLDTLAVETNYYNLLPSTSETYVLHGSSITSGCPKLFMYNVQASTNITESIFSSVDSVCLFMPIQLDVVVDPPGQYSYLWTPSIGLSNSTIPNPIATPPYSMNYSLHISTEGGCSTTNDSILLNVSS